LWKGKHSALTAATSEQREAVCRVLLDFMRRELAIQVDVLEAREHERIVSQSRQYLTGAWAIDDEERLERSAIALPRSHSDTETDARGSRFVYLSPRGGFGQFLKRNGVLPALGPRLTVDDAHDIIVDLLKVLAEAGIAHVALQARRDGDVPGYQLKAAAILWKAADGTTGFHDPVRVPNAPPQGLRTNPFFVRFYQSDATDIPPHRGPRAHGPGPSVGARGPRAGVQGRPAADPVLLADDGARRRHLAAQRREHAQRAADPGELRAAQRPRGPAGLRVRVLLGRSILRWWPPTTTTSPRTSAPSPPSPARRPPPP
jgi:hypothetical protein